MLAFKWDLQSTNHFHNEIKNKTFLVKMSFIGIKISPRSHVSGYFWIRNFFFPDTASVHTYPKNPAYESTTFLICSPEWKFLNTLWIQNRVDAKPRDIFLSGDITRSSPVLYHEYLDACSVANIPRGVLGARVYPDTCRIRVDGQIRFENRYVWTWKFLNPEKNELRIQKYPDTSGRDLNALNLDSKQRPRKTIRQGGS